MPQGRPRLAGTRAPFEVHPSEYGAGRNSRLELHNERLGLWRDPATGEILEAEPSQLLHKIEEIRIGSQSYRPNFFEQVYNEISKPKNQTFYESPNLKAYTQNGDVGIQRNLGGGVGWSYHSPEEILAVRPGMPEDRKQALLASPPVHRELRQVSRSFQDFLGTEAGQGVYDGSPVGGLDGKRAKIYRTMGFEDVKLPAGALQVLDNRIAGNEDVARLMAVGDQLYRSPAQSQALMQSRIKRSLPIYQITDPVHVNDIPLPQYLAIKAAWENT